MCTSFCGACGRFASGRAAGEKVSSISIAPMVQKLTIHAVLNVPSPDIMSTNNQSTKSTTQKPTSSSNPISSLIISFPLVLKGQGVFSRHTRDGGSSAGFLIRNLHLRRFHCERVFIRAKLPPHSRVCLLYCICTDMLLIIHSRRLLHITFVRA